MRKVLTIAQKEFSWYFITPIGYVLLALFAGLTNFLAIREPFLLQQATVEPLFSFLPWFTMVLVATVSMRAIAEEKKNGTIEILFSLPVSVTQVVLGKFIGIGLFLLLAALTTSVVPVTLYALGQPDTGVVIAGYFATLLFNLTLLSIGLLLSALSRNQVGAVFTSLVVFFLLLIVGSPLITDQVPQILRALSFFISPVARFENMARGVIDLRDVVYFVSLIVGFLYLSVEVLKRKR